MNIKKALYYGTTVILAILCFIYIPLQRLTLTIYEQAFYNNEITMLYPHGQVDELLYMISNIIIALSIITKVLVLLFNKKNECIKTSSKEFKIDRVIFIILLVVSFLLRGLTTFA